MAINRYDQPAQAQFTNTYVPIPFDEMMKIGMLKQAKIEEGQQKADEATAALSAFKVAAPDEPEYLRKQGEYLKKLDNLYNDSGSTGSVEFIRGVNKLKAEMATDTDLRSMAQNYPTYNKLVSDVHEAEGKFGVNSPASYRARKQLNEFTNGAADENGNIIKGTKYLQQKTGMGVLQPLGIGSPAAAQPVLDEYLAPVKADSMGTEGIDASGMFRVGNKNSGITYNKLGAVLGLTFKDEVRDGRRVAVLDTDTGVNIPADFYNTEAGAYMAQAAEQMADQSDGAMTKQQAFESLYTDAALRSINSHVSSSSEQSLDVNPYSMEAYKKKAADEKPVYTMPFLIGTQDTGLNNAKAISTSKDSLQTKVLNIQKKKEEYVAKNGVDSNAKDENGRYVGSVLSEFDAQAQQEQDKIAALDKLVEDTKKDAGIGASWDIHRDFTAEELKDIEEEAWSRAQSASKSAKGGGQDFSEITAKYEEIYNSMLEKKSDNYKLLNKKLAENAQSRLVQVGVTSFPTKSDENTMQDIVVKFTNEGAGKANRLGGGSVQLTDAKTGKPYEDQDYEKMARTTGENFKPEVLGMFYDTKKGWAQIMVRPKDKNGELLPAAYMDAPAGTEDIFIKAGKISSAEVMLQRELADITATANQVGSLKTGRLGDKTPGADKKDYVDVRVLMPTRQSYNPDGDTYEATFTNFETGTRTVKQYTKREDLIAAYIQYQQAKNEFEETGKISGM